MRANWQLPDVKELATQWMCCLHRYRDDPDGIVLALPNDGSVAVSIVSGMLHLPSEVFIAQSLRAPCRCECTIGALTETNVVYMDESVIARQAWPYRELRAYIEMETQRQRKKIARQRQILRYGRELPDLTNRHVLFVDDGAAAAATVIASIESFRKRGAVRIVAALPADSQQFIRDIRQRVDELTITMPYAAA